MAKGNMFASLTDAFHKADNSLGAKPDGFAGFGVGDNGSPMGAQTPAQHQSVLKAAKASVAKRKAAAMLKGRL